MEHLNQFYEVVYGAEEFLTADECSRVKKHVFGFLQHWAILAQQSVQANTYLWQVLPKHHYFAHMGLESSYWNPRYIHTYIDESFIGRICQVYHACLDGHYEEIVQDTVSHKWLLGLHILLVTI